MIKVLSKKGNQYIVRFQKGVDIFNHKPKHGVKYMIEEGLVGSDPEDIAAFFEETDNLDKSKIGRILKNVIFAN